jgi:hypothetical protein
VSFVSVLAVPLLLLALGALVTVPVAVTAHWAETLMLQSLLPHPEEGPPRGWKRVVAVARWSGAIGLTAVGALLASVLGFTAAGRTEVSWLAFGASILGAALVLLGHASLTVRTARRGAQLSGIDPWAAEHAEDRHLWRVLTRSMPLRHGDLIWLGAALVPPVSWVFLKVMEQRPNSGSTGDRTEGLAVWGGLCVFAFAVLTTLMLLERAQPHLVLVRWALGASNHAPASYGLWMGGPRAAVLLGVCARRRARRLPSSLRDAFFTSCGKLGETLRVAHLQQHTRPHLADTSRSAIQHSARIACCVDAFEGVRVLDRWLAQQGLLDLPAPLPQRGRFDPVVRVVDNLTGLVRNLIFLGVTVASFVLVVRAGWGPGEFVDRFR